MSSLFKIVRSYEKGLRGKSAVEIREAAKKIYTTREFDEFKSKNSKDEFIFSYASIVAGIVDSKIIAPNETKEDIFSEIVTDFKVGLNKAYDSFVPEGHSLTCKRCATKSIEIYESGNFEERQDKRFHIGDGGEVVLKSLNSWVMDHIFYRVKGGYDKEKKKRTQFKEYACPKCKRFTLERLRDDDEVLVCRPCTEEEGSLVFFDKEQAARQRNSFYNSDILSFHSPIGGNENKDSVLEDILYVADNTHEVAVLQGQVKAVIIQIKGKIGKWKPRKTGIFREAQKEAEMFDFLVPGDIIYSEDDLENMSDKERIRKMGSANKSLGLEIAEKAGYSYPYAVCYDCGREFFLGKNWEKRFEQLKKEGCPFVDIADEHQLSWTAEGVYDVVEARNNLTFQYRIGYERALGAGSNNGSTNFEGGGKLKRNKQTLSNYDERRINGLNLGIRSHKNGFSDIGKWAKTPLPEGYKGKKECITDYMHQVTNRWMGKLRNSCPDCKAELEELEMRLAGQGDFTCLSCGYTWKLREGEFLKRIKSNGDTKALYKAYLNLLYELLTLKKRSRVQIININNPNFGVV